MNRIKLPDLPREKEFEEYISAFLQSSRFYIERNIIERDIEEVLELDIIATYHNLTSIDSMLIEVKSGKWGFPDLFKLRGWMDYLGLKRAVFIAKEARGNIEFFRDKSSQLDIDLISIPDLTESKRKLSAITGAKNIEDVDINAWRFSYWLERNLLDRLNAFHKSDQDKNCFKSIKDYFFIFNSKIFFINDAKKRILELYDAYQKNQRLSARSANELAGNSFHEDVLRIPYNIYKDTFYNCEYNIIQISTYVEYKARLALLKNAIEYILTQECEKTIEEERSWKDVYSRFPESFKNGLSKIENDEFLFMYPIFWQWFLWIFGGFILKDYPQDEYELISKKTGIPIDEIPKALKCFDLLFPINGNWFKESDDPNIKYLKLFSIPFMGIGANYRRWIYTKNCDFDELKLSGSKTKQSLLKWNELLIYLLGENNQKISLITETGSPRKIETDSAAQTEKYIPDYSPTSGFELKSYY